MLNKNENVSDGRRLEDDSNSRRIIELLIGENYLNKVRELLAEQVRAQMLRDYFRTCFTLLEHPLISENIQQMSRMATDYALYMASPLTTGIEVENLMPGEFYNRWLQKNVPAQKRRLPEYDNLPEKVQLVFQNGIIYATAELNRKLSRNIRSIR